MSVESRFWAKVDRSGDCWLWTGARTRGYGQIKAGDKVVQAHRVSYEIHHGPIPEGYCVRHRCDNPACVNPAHLSLGTQADNIADMVERERNARGEKNRHARLFESDVRRMRRARKSGASLASIAKDFGVTAKHAGAICRGERWAHV